MSLYHGEKSGPIALDASAPGAGQAVVYPLLGDVKRVVKFFPSAPGTETLEKLRWMIANPPLQGEAGSGQFSFAWPEELVLDEEQEAVGILLPPCRANFSLLEIYNPLRRRQNNFRLNWRQLHQVARNLAAAVAALHQKGYVVGDLNQGNILVAPDLSVTLIETDSWQVSIADRIFACTPGREEVGAPELIGANPGETRRTIQSDLYALAVLIYQLLQEGSHPMRGNWKGSAEAPSIPEKIRRGLFPYGPKKGLNEPLLELRPNFYDLRPGIQRLFLRAFVQGTRRPQARPSAAEWQKILARKSFKRCTVERDHIYSPHSSECPWCARERALQALDAPQPKLAPATPPVYRQAGLLPVPAEQAETPPGGKPILQTRHSDVDFEPVICGQTPPVRSLLINNLGSGTLEVQISLSDPGFSSSPAALQLKRGESERIFISAGTQAKPGRVRAEIILTSNGGNQRIGVVATYLEGRLVFEPQKIDFGLLRPGEVQSRDLFVSSLGSTSQVYTLSSEQNWLSFAPQTLTLSSEPVRIQLVAAAAAQQDGEALEQMGQLVLSSPGMPPEKLEVKFTLSAPRLEAPARLDLGRIAPASLEPVEVRLANSGSTTLHGKVLTSTPWIRLPLPEFEIEPASKFSLPISLDASLLAQISETEAGNGSLVIESDGGRREIGLTAALGTPQLELSESRLDLGEVQPGQEFSRRIRISNRGNAMLRCELELETFCPWLNIAPAELSCPPGQSRELNLTLNEEAVAARAEATQIVNTLNLKSNAGSFQIPISGWLLTPLMLLDKTEIDLGLVEHGELIETKLILKNRGKARLKVHLQPLTAWLKVDHVELELQPEEAETLTLQVDTRELPREPGQTWHAETLFLASNAGDMQLPLSFELVCGMISAQPETINFGRITGLRRQEHILTIYNPGAAELRGEFTHLPEWIQPSKTSFRVPAGRSMSLSLNVDGLLLKTRGRDKILIQSNAGDLSLPVQAEPALSILQLSPHQLESCREAADSGWLRLVNRGLTPLPVSLKAAGKVVPEPRHLTFQPNREETITLQFPAGEENLSLSIERKASSHQPNEKLLLDLQPKEIGEKLVVRHGEARIALADGGVMDLVYIPAGHFLTGSDFNADKLAEEQYEPRQRLVRSESFWMGKFPVTHGQYRLFLEESGQPLPPLWNPAAADDLPVVNVSWLDAAAYCQWFSIQTGLETDLPDELSWEKAARGTDGRIWPWGNNPPGRRMFPPDRIAPQPVGSSSPASDAPTGCVDMVGNVAQWMKDSIYDPENKSGSSAYRLLKGGSWFNTAPVDTRAAARRSEKIDTCLETIGFRICIRLE